MTLPVRLLEYKEIGVTQFIMSGWPELDEVVNFGNEVVPRVRRAEAQAYESAGFTGCFRRAARSV